MEQIEVGDIVKVVDAGYCCKYYGIGDQGIVTEVSSFNILVDFNNHTDKVFGEGVWYVELRNIKLIRKGK